jgi:pimeloyl-[acyl-carrier protein] methyl ester esterase
MNSLYTESAGNGPTLLLWHGWGMNLRVFDDLSAVLRLQHHVVTVDLPGHGRSPWQAHYTSDSLLDELLPLVPAGATIVGWSLGSQLALRAAQRLGAAVRALVLLNPTPRFLNSPDWPHGVDTAVMHDFAQGLQHSPEQLLSDFFDLQLRGSRAPPALMQRLRATMMNHGVATPAALAAGLHALETQDLRTSAALIPQATLIISGQHDRVTPPAAAQTLATLLPNARCVELKRAAHLPFVSHRQETSALIQEFLRATASIAA